MNIYNLYSIMKTESFYPTLYLFHSLNYPTNTDSLILLLFYCSVLHEILSLPAPCFQKCEIM